MNHECSRKSRFDIDIASQSGISISIHQRHWPMTLKIVIAACSPRTLMCPACLRYPPLTPQVQTCFVSVVTQQRDSGWHSQEGSYVEFRILLWQCSLCTKAIWLMEVKDWFWVDGNTQGTTPHLDHPDRECHLQNSEPNWVPHGVSKDCLNTKLPVFWAGESQMMQGGLFDRSQQNRLRRFKVLQALKTIKGSICTPYRVSSHHTQTCEDSNKC